MQAEGSNQARGAAAWLSHVPADTEMGRLVQAHDWSSTPLGPPDTWPAALRSAVTMCLSSRFPMLVVWGPDLVKIYNDGYRRILGSDKHPQALGAPAREVWGEIWDVIAPMFDQVMTTGEPTWSDHEPLVLERNGYPEECWFTWGYSALRDDDGAIGGVLDVVVETTDEVLSARRLACLAALGTALSEGADLTELCVRATTTLGRWPNDLPAVDLYLRSDGVPVLVASSRPNEQPPMLAEEAASVLAGGEPVVHGRRPDCADGPAERVVIPVGGSGVEAILSCSLNPQRPFDDDYRSFVLLISQSVGAALDRAYRQAVEVGTYRTIADTLQAAMLKPASDLPTVAARYLPAEHTLAVGGDWYDVIDLGDDRRALVVGDCVGHDLRAAAAMSQLRSAARAMLLDGRSAAETLDGLDLFAESVDDALCATVAVAVVARGSRSLTYARAGHVPPLVVSARGVERLDAAAGPPLGVVPGLLHAEETVELLGDEMILLCSDGLVERRGEPIDVGIDRLGAAASEAMGLRVQEVADHILATLLADRDEGGDDVVLVVKQLVPVLAPA